MTNKHFTGQKSNPYTRMHTYNYRPVTLSSTFSKLFESIIVPSGNINDNQYGFRKGCGTPFGTSLLSDIMCRFKCAISPIYICSLDAEKCFDSIWHHILFYKIFDFLPMNHWRFLYNWYSDLSSVIKWENHIYCNMAFDVTRRTRQGNILSPIMFNLFIYKVNYCLNLRLLEMVYA
jgi:hypothetical protein